MSARLAPQPWMTAPATLAVMNALEARGGAGSARFVGGCVRDAVMRRPVGDVDIATSLAPREVIAALEDAGLAAIPTGIEHGTVTARSGSSLFEVTTLRRDVQTDGRRAVVAFTDDWAEDAARRDFRLNALYCDRDGALLDPTGAGVEDARAGRVVFVGEPRARLREDHLRILRYFRFLAWFGRGDPDAEALSACAAEADAVRTLSGERLARELLKLLDAEDPRGAMELMAACGVLAAALPEADGLARLKSLVAIETEILFTKDAELRLGSLLADAERAEAAARRLRLPGALQTRLCAALAADGPRLVSWLSPREIRRALYRLGARTFKDRVMLAWAERGRPAAAAQWRMLLVYADTWTPPVFPLRGEEIMAAGVPEGPLVGEVRREVESWWVELDFTDDELALLERLKAVAQGLAY